MQASCVSSHLDTIPGQKPYPLAKPSLCYWPESLPVARAWSLRWEIHAAASSKALCFKTRAASCEGRLPGLLFVNIILLLVHLLLMIMLLVALLLVSRSSGIYRPLREGVSWLGCCCIGAATMIGQL